jgi:hypothetical protein
MMYKKDDFPSEYYLNKREGVFSVSAPSWDFSPLVSYEQLEEKIKKDPRRVARDFGSKPEFTESRLFFVNFDPILKCFSDKVEFHPFEDDDSLKLKENRGNTSRLVCNPSVPHFLHLDLAVKRDCVGMAMCHLCPGKNTLDRELIAEGKLRKKIHLDFMVKMRPPKVGEIQIKFVRQFIIDLWKRGVNFTEGLITMDTWQSRETMQELKKYDMNVEMFSCDKNIVPWDTFYDVCLNDRLKGYYYEPVIDELRHLIFVEGKKVDHEPDRSKDVADALVGCVTNCVTNEDEGFPQITFV